MQVGILGVGSHLPSEIRNNDWWPSGLVERWIAADAGPVKQFPLDDLTAGEKLVLGEMAALKSDPFRGASQRRVLPSDQKPSDAEEKAARLAIAKAGIDPNQVDFVLSSSFVPDVINVPNAAVLHRRLGLPQRCYTSGLDAGCNAMPMQLALAEQMIRGEQARYGLLVQSSILSRLLPYDEPFSTYFGDGATALVVGPVPPERGILGRAHFSNGADCGALIASVPGKEWYDEGRCVWHQAERSTIFRMLITVADMGRQGVLSACEDAGVRPEEIDFFACHQGTPWFRSVIQEHAGLGHAKTLDTFESAGSLVGANIGLILDQAEHEGSLRDGDLVSVFASGVGSTWSGLVLRWGG